MTEVAILKASAKHSLDELAELAAAPLESSGAVRAVAFGSYARGTADGYADLDLIVVVPTERPRWERGDLVAAVVDALPVPVDLLILTPDEFDRGMDRGMDVFDAVAREGVTIYERSSG